MMSGYKLGIVIVVVLVIIGALVFWLKEHKGLHIGPPTEATAGIRFMQPIGLARTPHAFMPVATGNGAGRMYIAAYQYLIKHAPSRTAMDKIDRDPFANKNPIILHLAKIIEAAARKSVSRRYILFSKTIPAPAIKDVIKNRLEVIATALSDLGEAYLVKKHPHQAKKVFSAVMAFGYRLWIHGLLIDIRSSGLGAMSGAITGLRQIYSSGKLKNRAVRRVVDRFRRDLRTTTHRWLSKLRVVDTINPVPGDMANVVRHDQDLSWRIAAINELGYARWNVTSRSQRQAIINLLSQLEHGRNKYLQQAAHNALNLTAADMNQM